MSKYAALLGLIFTVFLSEGQKADNLVAKFTFNNGNEKDEVGETHAKRYGVRLTEDRFGNKNSAVFFHGNPGSYVNLGSSLLLKPKVGSISLWAKIDQAVYTGEGIHCNPVITTRSRLEDDFDEGYAIYYEFYLRKFHCNISFSEHHQVTLYPVEVSYFGCWYHLAMTYDNNTLTYYVNGIMEGKVKKDFESVFLKEDSVIVGALVGPKNNRYFQGSVDDIQIFNKVLTPKEIAALYNEPDPNKNSLIIKYIAYIFLCFLFIALIVLFLKWRIAKALSEEKEKNQLRNNWYEQENKVLTAQMNPHFIFNSLNTIQQFIIINDNEKAQLYLSKFSRLLRMVLENNTKDNITLKEEIEIIEKYLEIESLRFNNVFSYEMKVDKALRPETMNIPRFLIQPFVENAIWHGLLPKDGEKDLSISFEYAGEKVLSCTVEDNGVGRKNDQRQERKEKGFPLAINFIKQRLQLMCKIYKEDYQLIINDKTDQEGKGTGTSIRITIPVFKN